MTRGTCTLVVVALTALAGGSARADHEARDGWAIGYALHRAQDDFGMGAAIATPRFAGDRLRISLGGGGAWSPHAVTGGGEQDWAGYGQASLLLEAGRRAPGSPVRLYGFGGPLLFFLPDRLSDDSLALGGVGGFGFEYYFMEDGRDGPVSYYTELGGVGTNARADKLAGSPMLANGFLIAVGLRWTL
jgi:hypothetical protein